MRSNSTIGNLARTLALAVPLVAGTGAVLAAAAGDWTCGGRLAPINKPGFKPGGRVLYSVRDAPDGRPFPKVWWPCVRGAFDAWTRANVDTGLAVRFVPGTGGIVVRFDSVRPVVLSLRSAGGWSSADRDPQRATIWISSNPALIDDCRGITKVLLHELGHLHGLADQPRDSGPSVMNRGVRQNDRGERIPMTPTPCDARQALAAARSWQGVVLAHVPRS